MVESLVVEKQEKTLQRLYIKASQLWSSDYDNFFILHHTQRVRLDCDREASHNLNRLLDKPGEAAMNLLVMEITL